MELQKFNTLEAPKNVPFTHPRSDYPFVGCVPAEPTSFSPDNHENNNQKYLEHPSHGKKIPGTRGLAPLQHASIH